MQEGSHSPEFRLGQKRSIDLVRYTRTSQEARRQKALFKMVPRRVIKDKETLYAEGLNLKKFLNKCSSENVQLRTRLAILEKQNIALSRSQGVQRGTLFPSLKLLLLKKKEEAARLEEENLRLKKMVKFTNSVEQEAEIRQYVAEIGRLKEIIEAKQQNQNSLAGFRRKTEQMEGKLKELKDICSSLDSENQSLNERLRRGEEEKGHVREKQLQNQSRLNDEIAQLKRKLKLRDSQLADQEKQLADLKRNNSGLTKELNLVRKSHMQAQRELRQRSRQCESLKVDVGRRNQVVESRKQKDEQKNLRNYPIQEEESGYYEDDYQQFEEFNPEQSQPIERMQTEEKEEQEQAGQESPARKEETPALKKQHKAKRKPKSKPAASLGEIALFLAHRMRAMGYNTESLVAVLRESGIELITISELFKMLESEPFFVGEEADIQALLQYFFKTKELRPDLELSFQTFEARFVKLIPQLELIEEDEQERLYDEITKAVQARRESLLAELKLYEDMSGLVEAEMVKKIFLKAGLEDRHVEFMITVVSGVSKSWKALSYLEIFNRFALDTE